MEPKFQKGDRVRLLTTLNTRWQLCAGDIGTVISSSYMRNPRMGGFLWVHVVDWGKTVDTTGTFGGYTLWAVSEGLIEPALETAMPELDPAFTDLL